MIVAGYYGIMLAAHLSYNRPTIFLFTDDNLCKCQWFFTKLGVCIDIVENWFGIADGQILSLHWYCGGLVWDCRWANYINFWLSDLPVICPYFHFRLITLININGFSPNLVCALILWRPGLGLLIGKFRQFMTVFCLWHIPIFISGR